jgi:hypothetical protein
LVRPDKKVELVTEEVCKFVDLVSNPNIVVFPRNQKYMDRGVPLAAAGVITR